MIGEKEMRKVISILMIVMGILFMSLVRGCKCNDDKEVTYHYLTQDKVEVETKVMRVYTDLFFTDEERHIIWRAMDRWNLVMNGYVKMEDGGGFMMEIEKIKEAESGGAYIVMRLGVNSPLIKNEPGKMTLGFTDAIGGKYLYLVPDYIGEENLYGVVLHEFGHLMGARHTETGLMKAGYSVGKEVCVDKETVSQIKEYDWNRMNYCVRDNMDKLFGIEFSP